MKLAPDILALLEATRTTLVERVAPALRGGERYEALLAANALATAVRELAVDAEDDERERDNILALLGESTGERSLDDASRALAEAIRAGAFAEPARARALHALLRASTARLLAQTNPAVAAKYR